MRTLISSGSTANERRAYFDVRLLDNTPANGEVGLQPEIKINNGSWNTIGISVLSFTGAGSYYAELDSSMILVVGDIIETRYQRVGITLLSRGDTFQVVESNSAQPTVASYAFNAYLDDKEADLYFSNRVNSQVWTRANIDQKMVALRHATRLIDRLNFRGDKTDSNQLLQFPRDDDVIIPLDIKFACCEVAIKLLDGVDTDLEINALAVDSHGYGSVKTNYNRRFIPDHTLAGIPSAMGWSYLVPYLRDVHNLVLSRVD